LINNHINFKKKEKNIKINKIEYIESDISIKKIDYYFTNPIARSSKTMSECRRAAKKLLSNGIEKVN